MLNWQQENRNFIVFCAVTPFCSSDTNRTCLVKDLLAIGLNDVMMSECIINHRSYAPTSFLRHSILCPHFRLNASYIFISSRLSFGFPFSISFHNPLLWLLLLHFDVCIAFGLAFLQHARLFLAISLFGIFSLAHSWQILEFFISYSSSFFVICFDICLCFISRSFCFSAFVISPSFSSHLSPGASSTFFKYILFILISTLLNVLPSLFPFLTFF